jgi:hypothetical protein
MEFRHQAFDLGGSPNKIIIERVDFRTRHSTHKQEAASVISKFTEFHLSTEPKGE